MSLIEKIQNLTHKHTAVVEYINAHVPQNHISKEPVNGKLHLKGLNGIRAFAAILVIATHVCEVFTKSKLQMGGFGVTIFFTLSGFLITYLLFKEKEITKTVSVKNFYKRRMLRIWPLYLLYLGLAVIISDILLKGTFDFNHLWYYIFFIPNIAFVKGKAIPVLNHYWSLGLEEQFYFFWPLVIRYVKGIWFTYSLLTFLILFIVFKIYMHSLYGFGSQAYRIFYYFRFDCMAIGGLAAYFYYIQHPVIRLFSTRLLQLLCWLPIAFVVTENFHISHMLDQDIIAIATVGIIVSQISLQRPVINLENKAFDYIGKISFGLYVFHPLVITLLVTLYKDFATPLTSFTFITLPFEVLVVTFILAHFSYYFFESKFLTLKQKYTVITANSSIMHSSL